MQRIKKILTELIKDAMEHSSSSLFSSVFFLSCSSDTLHGGGAGGEVPFVFFFLDMVTNPSLQPSLAEVLGIVMLVAAVVDGRRKKDEEETKD